MADPYSTMIPQLIGAGASIAGALPNKQDRLQRRIAMGGEDPALQAIRRQLAAQNAQTAMSVAASQQGVNPALAQRNAQQALAQQQVQTNSELARMGVNSAMQARSSDPKGQKISAALQGVGQLANVFGTGLAAQNAGMAATDAAGVPAPITDAAMKQQLLRQQGGAPGSAMNLASPAPSTPPAPAALQMVPGMGGESAGGLASPGGQYVSMPPAATPDFIETVNPDAPSAFGGPPSAQFAPSGVTGSGVEGLGTPPVQPLPPQTDPRTFASPEERPITPPVAAPPPAVQQPQAPLETGAPTPRPSDSLPPELVADQGNAGLIELYNQAVASGDDIGAQLFLRAMQASTGVTSQAPAITSPYPY